MHVAMAAHLEASAPGSSRVPRGASGSSEQCAHAQCLSACWLCRSAGHGSTALSALPCAGFTVASIPAPHSFLRDWWDLTVTQGHESTLSHPRTHHTTAISEHACWPGPRALRRCCSARQRWRRSCLTRRVGGHQAAYDRPPPAPAATSRASACRSAAWATTWRCAGARLMWGAARQCLAFHACPAQV